MKAYEEWGRIYLKFSRKRYTKQAAGGGEWASLKPSYAKKKGHGRILVDTNSLRRSIDPARKSLIHTLPAGKGVEVRLGSNRMHSSGLSFSTLGSFHQHGYHGKTGYPAREIYVQPDPAATQEMVEAMEKAIEDAKK